MKRIILFVLYSIYVCYLFSQTISSTLSINTTQLTNIRNASLHLAYTPNDPLIYKFWHDYTRETRDAGEDSILLDRDRNFTDNFILETPAIDAYKAIVGEGFSSAQINTMLDGARNYLYEFDWYNFELAINNPHGYSYTNDIHGGYPYGNVYEHWRTDAPYDWHSLEPYTRGRELAYN